MQHFQSLKRLLFFYVLTLLIMLSLYYAEMFIELKTRSQQYSLHAFTSLQHEFVEHINPTDTEVKKILDEHFFQDVSYQLLFMLSSGQTYIHRYTRPGEREFTTVTFPTSNLPYINNDSDSSNSTYTLTNKTLTGVIKLKSGQQLYVILRHQPLKIDWISYRYWLPLMTAIILFIIALLYMLNRRANWEKLLLYTDSLNVAAKEAYSPPPFNETRTTPEFSHLGYALSRISYQLHNNHRRIKMLNHRLERLVDQSPLPMMMIMRHGQVSFFNKRFEHLFATSFQSDINYQLTDFVISNDELIQKLLHKLSTLRVTRTLLVYGIENKQAYQLHITPWFGEHGQVHGFTVLLNNVNEFVTQTESLQQQNEQLQLQLNEYSRLRSSIAHELRSPLDAIIGILELIDPSTLTVRQHEILVTLTQSSHSMLALLNDMLDMTKIEEGKAHIITEPVDIFRLGRDVSNIVTGDSRRQGLELLYFFAPDCPRYIDTDSSRLRQILLNLLDNAIKFTTTGYVALIIEPVVTEPHLKIQKRKTEEHALMLSTDNIDDIENIDDTENRSNAHHWIRFSVQDTGVGIASAGQNQLFTYVNQANILTGQQSGHKGLGLDISNSFAQLLGGFIELDSTINKGSTFTLYLPCRRPNYQPVYHFNYNLTQIHLIAVINQKVRATNLQRLCQYLSIPASIYTSADMTSIQRLTEKLAADTPALIPILLLDYEYCETNDIALADHLEDDNNKVIDNEGIDEEAIYQEFNLNEASLSEAYVKTKNHTNNNTKTELAADSNGRKILISLLANTSLPKILLSMKPERRISSTVLDKFDGFLSKPLDNALLLSELMRLTLPMMKPIVLGHIIEGDATKLATAENNQLDEKIAPLILVVEDSVTNQKITCKLLSKIGYRSVIAEDGQQALDLLKVQRQEIALILMDCRMPVMDGLQATKAIRAQGDDIIIVALTANNTEEDREACIAVGMDGFLSKPINKEKLQAVLQEFIKT